MLKSGTRRRAARCGGQAASPPSPRASRARCLIGLLRVIPGGSPFVDPAHHPSTLHRWGLGSAVHSRRASGGVPSGAPRRAAARQAPRGLNRREGQTSAASPTLPTRPPHPAPRLETLDQTPLGNGAGRLRYRHIHLYESIVLDNEL